jgi:ubiquinone/menaquinone biosynthesis C-methylase UbiE
MQIDITQYPHNMQDQWNNDWDKVANIYYWRLRYHYQTVEQYLHGTILDVGCGPGYLAARAWPNESVYTGLDISSKAVEIGKMLFPAATFKVHDAEHVALPFQDNAFDTVIASEILEHLVDIELLISEVRRVTRNYMLFTVPRSMGGVGHVRPIWEWDDVVRVFSPLGYFLEIRCQYEGNFWLIWMRK